MNQINVLQKKINFKGLIRAPGGEDILKALILIICQRASLFGLYPFGNAFLMSLTNTDTAYLYIPTLALGAFLSGGEAARYIISALIICIYKALIPSGNKNKLLNSAVCAGALFVCGLYYVLSSASPKTGFLMLLFEAGVGFLCCHIFSNAGNLFEKQKNNGPASREGAVSL